MNISFFTPPLVEGPKIAFFVPLPKFLHQVPLAMNVGNGEFGLPVSMTVVSSWFCIFVLFLIFKLGTKKLEVVPRKRLQIILESLLIFLDSLVFQSLGKYKDKFISFISCLFLFILSGNILSFFPIPWISEVSDKSIFLRPAFRAPTVDLNTTVGLALLTAVVFIGTHIKKVGLFGYIKSFTSPLPILLPLNIISELAKPVNMSFRLFGNMFAGMVIMGLLYKAAPAIVPGPLHLYFDLFSGVVQSFVFIMLSIVHIQSSLGDSVKD